MLNVTVIGAGAAGNKAVIDYSTSGVAEGAKIALINSTKKDIPKQYREDSAIFGTNSEVYGGCGKERNLGKRLMLHDLQSGNINLDTIIDKEDSDLVVIVSSTEGGTGSAITPIIAKYVKEVMEIPVIVVAFFGFNSDVRGMQNSIEFCQELSDNYAVIGISNHKFLKDAKNSLIEAEKLANKKFVDIMKYITGSAIVAGNQNIDDTDLYKILSTPGYTCIESADLSKVNSIEEFNATINEAMYNSYLLDSGKRGCKRIGVVYDVPDSMNGCIDFSATNLKEKYGTPYEMFTHVQNDNGPSITWIATGLSLPTDEVKEIYEKYKISSAEVNKSKDSFFEELASLRGNNEDAMFDEFGKNESDTEQSTNKSKDFFNYYGLGGSEDKS